MCGIAGIFDIHGGRPIEMARLEAMIDMIHHRGPDSKGIKLFNHIGLAHARLSIIDLKTGDQPIHNEDQTVWTIFNGEIFNYLELRKDLLSKGHHFSTQTDTEVIVHLYEEYGDDFVSYLNGQFAIALYDAKYNRLIFVRDRVGIVPLYYIEDHSRFYFASEIKSLLIGLNRPPSINYRSLDQIFTFWSPVSPETIFIGIYEV